MDNNNGGGVEIEEGSREAYSGGEGWGEKAENCTWTTILKNYNYLKL